MAFKVKCGCSRGESARLKMLFHVRVIDYINY